MALTGIGFTSTIHGAASLQSCHSIDDNNERLLCYDNYHKSISDTSTVDTEETNKASSILEKRLKKEESINYNEFAITPHKPNYMLPITYNNNPNSNLYENIAIDDKLADNLSKYELKFQLSFKIPLIKSFIYKDSNLWFAYSQVAFWQMYNLDASSPFRETNYEPEIIWANKTNYEIFGFKNSLITLALNHQSNGRSKPLSRSWNRIIADFILEKENVLLSFKPWYRIPEDDEDDGNPDIEKYMGYADFSALVKYNEHLSTVLLRNNFRSKNKTTVELTYTFRFNDRLKGIAQYFNGYGESLIDYNHRSQRIGVGILITDWL